MTGSKRIFAMVLVALGIAVAGCGGGDDEGKPIPAATASALQTQLDNVQARLDQGSAGACKDILEGPRGPNRDKVQEEIDSMPDDVDADVRSALQDSFDNLWDQVDQECEDKASKEKPETNTTTTETPTETTETQTETEPTETQTETTPTETTPPAEEQLPPDGNGENGGAIPGTGNGGGVGPSGAQKEAKDK